MVGTSLAQIVSVIAGGIVEGKVRVSTPVPTVRPRAAELKTAQ